VFFKKTIDILFYLCYKQNDLNWKEYFQSKVKRPLIISAEAIRTAGSNAEAAYAVGNFVALLIELKAQFYKLVT